MKAPDEEEGDEEEEEEEEEEAKGQGRCAENPCGPNGHIYNLKNAQRRPGGEERGERRRGEEGREERRGEQTQPSTRRGEATKAAASKHAPATPETALPNLSGAVAPSMLASTPLVATQHPHVTRG